MSPALALCHADSVPYQPTPHPVALIIWLDCYHGKREGSRDLVIDRRGLVHGITANNALAELCHAQVFAVAQKVVRLAAGALVAERGEGGALDGRRNILGGGDGVGGGGQGAGGAGAGGNWRGEGGGGGLV